MPRIMTTNGSGMAGCGAGRGAPGTRHLPCAGQSESIDANTQKKNNGYLPTTDMYVFSVAGRYFWPLPQPTPMVREANITACREPKLKSEHSFKTHLRHTERPGMRDTRLPRLRPAPPSGPCCQRMQHMSTPPFQGRCQHTKSKKKACTRWALLTRTSTTKKGLQAILLSALND
jgi:hypothetical protein